MRTLNSILAEVSNFNRICIAIFQDKNITKTEELNKHFPQPKFHYFLEILFLFPL